MYFFLLSENPYVDSFSQCHTSTDFVFVEHPISKLKQSPEQDVFARGVALIDTVKYKTTEAAVDSVLIYSKVSHITDAVTLRSKVTSLLKKALGIDVSNFVYAAFQQFPKKVSDVVEFMRSLRINLIQFITGQTKEPSWISAITDVVQSVKEVGVEKTAKIYLKCAAYSARCSWNWAKAKLFG